MSYDRHALMTDPARPSAELWRLGLGLIVALAVMFGLARGIVAMLRTLLDPDRYLEIVAQLDRADTPLGLLGLLVLMGAMGAGTVVAAEMIHKRSAASLIGPPGLALRQFARVALALLLLNGAVALLPPWPLSQATEPGLDPRLWLALLPLTLLGLAIQTGSEELLFRGYLQSQLAARVAHPAVWIGLPSAAFALGHYAPGTYGDNALTIAAWSFGFGVAAADLTARAGTLGPAVALHMVNNFIAMALVSLQGDMSGLALYRFAFGPEDAAAVAALLPADLAMIGLSWLAARVALRR
ncbi:CPBP family intramembrane glutamic endopeptidase [Pseudoponticoccus marisrubri]|uniref:CAAX protease n=1 Tax=Pseudoponticoccus marisrubri TaxID=1685382 RepID=A0A0W7WHT0_9RHOB|nr:CPBP family intramembrane glutamic endopeptidase [Pseudoponticoccus marisrubri]KUF10145.1 CAAX protease [Pseudoponticoccus marisrubri]